MMNLPLAVPSSTTATPGGGVTLQDAYDNGSAGQQVIQFDVTNAGISIIGVGIATIGDDGDFTVQLSAAEGGVGSEEVGAKISLTAGNGSSSVSGSFTGAGGALILRSGAGGAGQAAVAASAGGAMTFTLGAGGNGGATGAAGNAGAFSIVGGAGGQSGGTSGVPGAGSSITMTSGVGGTAGNVAGGGGVGGAMTLAAGAGGVNLVGTSGTGGATTIRSGAGGEGSIGAGGAAGLLSILGGAGGTGQGGSVAGAGGAIVITGGVAGANLGGGGAIGGAVTITAGAGTGAAANGNVTLTPGVSAGAATGSVIVLANDAATATAIDLLTITHTSSGTVANSFGASQLWNLENAAGTLRSAARDSVIWVDSANATEDASYSIYLITAGTLSTTVPVVSFSGATGQVNTMSDATTNTSSDILTLTHVTSGTVANSFGSSLLWNLENAAGTTRAAVRQNVAWLDSTDASEDAEFRLYAINAGTAIDIATQLPAFSVSGAAGGRFTLLDAGTSTSPDVLTVVHRSTGTTAANFGTSMLVRGESSSDVETDIARLNFTLTNVGSFNSAFALQLRTGAAALTNYLTMNASIGSLILAGGVAGAGIVMGSASTIASSSSSVSIASGSTAGTVNINASATVATFKGLFSSGSNISHAYTPANMTAQTASTEGPDYKYTSSTKQFATGALTLQRFQQTTGPTIAFVGASTVTTAVTFAIDAAVTAGTNATIAANVALLVGGDVTQGATVATTKYNAIAVPNHTVTFTGSTQATGACSVSALRLDQITITDASAVTFDAVATLYIAAPPLAAGSVTLTVTYSLWVDTGITRLDGAVELGGSTTITVGDATNFVLNTGTGTKIGTGTTQKLGFYNAAPVVQWAAVADASGGAVIDAEARTALNALLARTRGSGLLAT